MAETEPNRTLAAYADKRQLREPGRGSASIDDVVFNTATDAVLGIGQFVAQTGQRLQRPAVYFQQYKGLRDWIDSTLDLYRPELQAVLFPLFVHSFLDLFQIDQERAKEFRETFEKDHAEKHQTELQRLAALTPELFKDNDLVSTFRNSKYNVRMCSFSHELLAYFLHDREYVLMTNMLGSYLNIQVHAGRPQKLEDEPSFFTGIGLVQGTQTNDRLETVLWGTMEPDIDPPAENAAKRQASEAARRARLQELQAHLPPSDRIPRPKVREDEATAELNALKEMRQRVAAGPGALPSICCYTFHNTNETLSSLTISPDSSLMCAGYSESYMTMHNLRGENLRSLKPSSELPTVQSIDPRDLTSLDDWMVDTGRPDRKLIGHSEPVYQTAITRDNQFLLSCSADATVRLWSLTTWTNLVAFKGHAFPVWSCDFAPIGHYFATGSHDRTARIWSCDHIYPLRILAGHYSDVTSVKFHPNSNYVATGSADKSVRFWDVQTGRCVRVFTGHPGAVQTVALSPDGRTLASAGEDGLVMLWDIASGKRLKRLAGHKGVVYSLSFTVDNGMLASGGADGCVRLWDVRKAGKDDGTAGMDETSKGDATSDLLGCFQTKSTPVQMVHFTYRNILLCGGAYTGA